MRLAIRSLHRFYVQPLSGASRWSQPVLSGNSPGIQRDVSLAGNSTGKNNAPGQVAEPNKPQPAPRPTRYYGSVQLDATRVGRDAGQVAEEVIAHLAGIVGANVKVTLDIEANIPSGASEQVVRTVTENGRTLKFKEQGFEEE